MQGQTEVVRFLSDCEEVWHRRFPALHRRAQPHIASYLCTRGRTGAAVGELSGMVRQVFLLDDATVRERVGDMVGLGLCALDPPNAAVSARSIVLPSEPLLLQFDAYLLEMAARLQTAAMSLDPDLRTSPPHRLDDDSRQAVLQAIECCRNDAIGAVERYFDEAGLSRARRLDARRHLLSASHWAIVLSGLQHRYGISPADDEGDGVLADQMAAALLSMMRQNFQTTRDHITYLMQLGLLERRQGRALRVALAEPAGVQFDRALAEAATELPRLARLLFPGEAEIERTAVIRPSMPRPAETTDPQHLLLVSSPDEPEREVAIGDEPVEIGRAPGSTIVLSAIEVSRMHCRVALADGVVVATDLNSTNGTLVDGRPITGTLPLAPGSVVQIGPYRLEYQRRDVIDPDATMRTRRGLEMSAAAIQRRRSNPG